MRPFFFLGLVLCALLASVQNMTLDTSGVRLGPVRAQSANGGLQVEWPDERGRTWTAQFTLDPRKPLIASIAVNGKAVLSGGQPFYRVETGKRRGGWDAFFDFPPSGPDGPRSFLGEFHPKNVRATTIGERLEVAFDGMRLGIFEGEIRYTLYPGSRLIEQQAAMKTAEQDVAYFYDAGLRMSAASDLTPGGTMDSEVSYFDTQGNFQTIAPSYGSERHPAAVRYRAVTARSAGGSVAVFPAPHQYMVARGYTTNTGYAWDNAWRGNISMGIR